MKFGWKWLKAANRSAFYNAELITAIKGFIGAGSKNLYYKIFIAAICTAELYGIVFVTAVASLGSDKLHNCFQL
jgi:hypothetical protein